MRLRALAPVLLIATVLLTACTSPTPAPSATVTSTPTPEPTVTALASEPLPRFDLACDDLVPPPATAFRAPVAPRDPIATYAGATGYLPRLSAIQAIGGLVCEWSNGQPQASVTGANPDYTGIVVSILPDASEQWARYASTYGITGSRDFRCASTASCGGDELVGEYWLTAEADGVADEAAIDSALAAIASALGNLPASRPIAAPPTGTVPLGADCTSLVGLSEVSAATGLADDLQALYAHGGWSPYAAAEQELLVHHCFWSHWGQEVNIGGAAAIPGGAGLGLHYLEVATAPTTATPLDVDGLAAGDSAWQRCSGSTCFVDVIAGGNWVQFSLDEAAGFPSGMDAAKHAIASAILRTMYA